MAEVVFVVDVTGWAKAFKSERGIVGAYIHDLTGDVVATTKFEAPGPGKFPRNRTGINYGKGQLMGTIDSKIHAGGIDEVEGHVIAKPKHAAYVIHGTKPHVIKAKKPGGRLRFYWFKKAKWMAVPSVKHPGTAANDFMIRALKRGFRANGLL